MIEIVHSHSLPLATEAGVDSNAERQWKYTISRPVCTCGCLLECLSGCLSVHDDECRAYWLMHRSKNTGTNIGTVRGSRRQTAWKDGQTHRETGRQMKKEATLLRCLVYVARTRVNGLFFSRRETEILSLLNFCHYPESNLVNAA